MTTLEDSELQRSAYQMLVHKRCNTKLQQLQGHVIDKHMKIGFQFKAEKR